ncbi:phage holin family protein [Serratia fonticola]
MHGPNDPGILEQTMKWIAIYLPSIYAGLVALGISALVDIRAGKPKLYTITGAFICGLFALAISAMLEYFGLPSNSGAFVGAIIGFVGADGLRDLALGVAMRRAGSKDRES